MSNQAARWRKGLFHALRGRPGAGRSWGSIVLHRLGEASAHSSAGVIAAAAVLAWVCVGAAVGFAAWWENLLYVVSSTVTLVMLFAIQHTQARQQSATQRKLDEIIRALPRADGRYIAVEEAPDDELEALAHRGRGDRAQALVGRDVDPVLADDPLVARTAAAPTTPGGSPTAQGAQL